MKTIIFPGVHRQPSQAAYGVVLESDNGSVIPRAHIVAWQTPSEHGDQTLVSPAAI